MIEDARGEVERSRALVWITIVAVVIGVFFRCYAVDRKIYGADETVSLLRVAGTTIPLAKRAVASGALHSTDDVRDRLEQIGPGSSPFATVRSLVVDDPQHPPLFYVLLHVWQIFGTSVTAERSLAVVFALLLLPASYWCANQLGGRTAALVTLALVAVSPFHVLFAQENREYSLWAFLTVVASGALLVALARGGTWRWAGYALAAIAGLYTLPLFLYVLVAHGAYVAIRAVRARAFPTSYVVASVVAAIAYLPWLAVIATHWQLVVTTTEWNAAALPPQLLLAKWAFEISGVFFDAEYARLALAPLAILAIAIAAAAAIVAVRRMERSAAAFVMLLIAATALPLVIPDLILHQSRSTAARYLTSTWIGLELLVAAGLAIALGGPRRARTFALGGVAGLVVLGTVSLAVSAGRTFWWIDSTDAPLLAIAAQLDAVDRPTLCYAGEPMDVLLLPHAARRAVALTSALAPGCLAIASDAQIHDASPRAHFVLASGTDRGVDPALAGVHAAVSAAHKRAYDPPQLWRLDHIGAK